MNLIITEKYKISFKSEYSVLDGYYQVKNTHTHHGVLVEELPFEDTIDIVRKAIESDAWEKKEQSEKQEQYNSYFKVARDSIFYELVDLNNERFILVPDVWIHAVDTAIMQCENMALVVDCGLQTQETSVILSNLKDEVGFRLKDAVQASPAEIPPIGTSSWDADTNWHEFKINAGKLYIDSKVMIDLGENTFSGTSVPFTIGSIIDSMVCMGMEISYVYFNDFKLTDDSINDIVLTLTDNNTTQYLDNEDGTAISRKDYPLLSVTWQDIDARTRTQDIVYNGDGDTGWGIRLNGSNRGVSTMTPTAGSEFIIRGRFTSLRTGIMGSWDPDLKAHYYFGINEGKWCFGWGEQPNIEYYLPNDPITPADTNLHEFKIDANRFLVDDEVILDRSNVHRLNTAGTAFLNESVPFTINNLLNTAQTNLEISSISFKNFKVGGALVTSLITFDMNHDPDTYTENGNDASELTDNTSTHEITLSPSTAADSMRVTNQPLYEGGVGNILRFEASAIGTTPFTPTSTSILTIRGKFLTNTDIIIGSKDVNKSAQFCFGILNGNWAFEYGKPLPPKSGTIINPTTAITSYGSVWVTEAEFAQIMAKRKQAIIDSGFVDYYDLYLEKLDTIKQLRSQTEAYKAVLADMHMNSIYSWEQKYDDLRTKYNSLRDAVGVVNTRITNIQSEIADDTVLEDAQTEAQKLTSSDPTETCKIPIGDYDDAEDL